MAKNFKLKNFERHHFVYLKLFLTPILLFSESTSDGSRSKFFDPGWVGSIFYGSGWVGLGRVGSAIYGLGLISKFSLKMSNFSIFLPLDKKKSLRVGSESTQVEGG